MIKVIVIAILASLLFSGCSFKIYSDDFTSDYEDDFKVSGVTASPEFIIKHSHNIMKYSYKEFINEDGRFIKKEDYEDLKAEEKKIEEEEEKWKN